MGAFKYFICVLVKFPMSERQISSSKLAVVVVIQLNRGPCPFATCPSSFSPTISLSTSWLGCLEGSHTSMGNTYACENLEIPFHVSVCCFETMQHIISQFPNIQHMNKKVGIGRKHPKTGEVEAIGCPWIVWRNPNCRNTHLKTNQHPRKKQIKEQMLEKKWTNLLFSGWNAM